MLLYDRHEPARQGDGGRLAEVVRLQRRRHDEDRRPAGREHDVQLPEAAIEEFLNKELKATVPEKSPNYNAMPFSDSKKRRPKQNKTVFPSSPSGKTIIR